MEGTGLEACGVTIHLTSSPAALQARRRGKAVPKVGTPPPSRGVGQSVPPERVCGGCQSHCGLDTPHGVCHPRTWETRAAFGHGTETLGEFGEKPAAHTILGRRSM